ncbi:MAG: protein BatD [Alistipes sp.]|nr:protein BatD [Alistipes sp.]
MKHSTLLRFTLLLVAIFSTLTSWAQVSFTVAAPTPVAVGSPFRAEFSIDSEPDRGSFNAPAFEGFEVIAGPSVSTGHSVQWINGKQTSSYNCTYTFVLMPVEEGIFTIAPATISAGGKSYSTEPLKIEVIKEQGSSSSSSTGEKPSAEGSIGKDDVFIRLRLSDTDVYKGESIRASLVLYTRIDIANIESLEMPPFNDFWSQELSFDNAPSREEYNGRIYQTYKLAEYLLSPQRSGKLTIDPVKMEIIAQVVVQDSRSIDPIFGGRQIYNVPRSLSTAPTTIDVKEFPAGAPATFNGAVGSFTMKSTLPESSIMVNTAEQIEITISGSGNLKFITKPRLVMPESFEVYDAKVADNVKVSAAGTSGSITYTFPFVARSSGEFTIDPVAFTYFDPATAEYHTLATERFTLSVADDGTSVTSAPTVIGGGYGGQMKQLDRDIRYIATDAKLRNSRDMFILSPMYWLVVVVIVALFVVAYLVLRRRIVQNRNVVARRMKRADKVAVQRLRMAQRYMAEHNRHAFYEELLRAMWGYISDKFNIPVSNLTKETIREELYRRNVSAADAEQFCQIISRADEAQYAPSVEGDMGEVYGDAVDVISKIESVVKR